MSESLFLVEKKEFKAFVERLIADKIRTEVVEERTYSIVKVFSIKNDACLCAQKWYNDDETPDEYYIFNLPEKDEWIQAIPKRKIELNEEETKVFFEELEKILKEKAKQ